METNRSKWPNNVIKFVDLYGAEKDLNQDMLFEDNEISFDDKKIFNQNYKNLKNSEILSNELDVIGFYFSDHPLNHYPKKFFDLENIKSFKDYTENNNNDNSIKVCGAILDIKERSNKDGKKYAFITVSEISYQFELTILVKIIQISSNSKRRRLISIHNRYCKKQYRYSFYHKRCCFPRLYFCKK